MLLQNKNAVIYGAGGSLGGAVAKALAAAGARVFLTGRNTKSVQQTADAIIATGGKAEVGMVNGFDENAVKAHLEDMLKKAGSVDISFNAVGINVVQNIPLIDISLDDFVQPITLTMKSRFITATAAGRAMKEQGSGVILSLTVTPGGIGYPYTGGFAPACCALESFSRNLASELGIYGIRVMNIRFGGSPDSRIFKDAIEQQPDIMAPILGKNESRYHAETNAPDAGYSKCSGVPGLRPGG